MRSCFRFGNVDKLLLINSYYEYIYIYYYSSSITFVKGLFDMSSLIRFVNSLKSYGSDVMFALLKFNYN